MIDLMLLALALLGLLILACTAVCRHCLREMRQYNLLEPWR